MESSATYKKATAVLDEAARARLLGPFVRDTTPSPSRPDDDELVDMVREFYNGNGDRGMDVDAEDAMVPRPDGWKDRLHDVLADARANVVARRIRAEVEGVLKDAAPAVGNEGIRRRAVEWLRNRGFDAGLCRSTSDRSSHEYVDVMAIGPSTYRYIVEINLASEFEIARPSTGYRELVGSLPPVLVARPESFKTVAAVMCAAAAESIRGAGMHVPPWRRARYMQAKWSSQHKRVAGVARTEAVEGTRPIAGIARFSGAPSGGGKFCRTGMGCREMTMERERLITMRPLFRGL